MTTAWHVLVRRAFSQRPTLTEPQTHAMECSPFARAPQGPHEGATLHCGGSGAPPGGQKKKSRDALATSQHVSCQYAKTTLRATLLLFRRRDPPGDRICPRRNRGPQRARKKNAAARTGRVSRRGVVSGQRARAHRNCDAVGADDNVLGCNLPIGANQPCHLAFGASTAMFTCAARFLWY